MKKRKMLLGLIKELNKAEPKVYECKFCKQPLRKDSSEFCNLYCREMYEKANAESVKTCRICGKPMINRFGKYCSNECYRLGIRM